MTQTRILTSEVCNRRKVVSMEVVVVMQELLAKLWFWEKVVESKLMHLMTVKKMMRMQLHSFDGERVMILVILTAAVSKQQQVLVVEVVVIVKMSSVSLLEQIVNLKKTFCL